MVEIREQASGDSDAAAAGGDATPPQPPAPTGFSAIFTHMRSRPVDTILWALRLVTVYFALGYTFPLGGPQQQASFYQKTLIAGAATNALRLHQRLGGFQLSREFFSRIFLEDSCHYLFYCVLFSGSYPVTMAVMPVLLFALLHSASYSMRLFEAGGMNGSAVYRALRSLTTNYTQTILSVVACTEIFLMPMLILMIFIGKGSLLVPFVYYRFLTLRYMSQRNPNTRMAFQQLRLALEAAVERPACPAVLRSAAHKLIALVQRLCPAAA